MGRVPHRRDVAEPAPTGTGAARQRSAEEDRSRPGEEASAGDVQGSGGPVARLLRLLRAVREGDDELAQEATLELSQSHRLLAPLGLVAGSLAVLFEGLRLLLRNWRLALVQLLPAMWIWLAMLDLKLHIVHGRTLRVLHGPLLVAVVVAVVAITVACFFLNAVFGFAVAEKGSPAIRPAFSLARRHLGVITGVGAVVGLALAVSTVLLPRWGRWWFVVSLSIVVAVMMVTYVAVPSRLLGIQAAHSRREAMTATAVCTVLGVVVATPGYVLGRIGILMLGTTILFVPGIFALIVGVAIQAGTTSTVKAVKTGMRLIGSRRSGDDSSESSGGSPGTGDVGSEPSGGVAVDDSSESVDDGTGSPKGSTEPRDSSCEPGA